MNASLATPRPNAAVAATQRLGPILPDLARGVRASFATLVPFYLARRFHIHELAWTALGGWLGTLADPGGLRLPRARALAAFAVSGAIVVGVAERADGSLPLSIVTLGVVAFGGSLLRAVGAATSAIGTLLVVAAAIALGGLAHDPARDAVAFLAGATWALVFSSVVWPVWTHLPVRLPLAACWRQVGAYATALDDAVTTEWPEGDPRWSEMARTRQAALRAAIEDARGMAIASRARRSGESVLGSNLRTLLALSERLLALLVAATESLEPMAAAERKAEWLAASEAIRNAVARVTAILEAPTLRVTNGGIVARDRAHGMFRRIVDGADMAMQIACNLSVRTEELVPAAAPTTKRVLIDEVRTLRDALSPRSTYFHHGVRVAIAVMLAQLIGNWLSPAHVSWVSVTVVGVLQPYAGATMKRAAERVVGTIIGSLVAVAIMMTVRDPVLLSLIMVPLSVASVATKPRSYRLFTLFLTPVFVLLVERFGGDWWTAAARAGDAAVGGALALAAALAFPSREDGRLGDALDRMLVAVRTYADIALEAHLAGKSSSHEVTTARRAVGVALGEAETSLERLLSEPLRSKQDAEKAMLLVTHARRFAGAVTALDQRHAAPANDEERALTRAVKARIDQVLTNGPLVEPSPQDAARPDLARIVRQADLLASAR